MEAIQIQAMSATEFWEGMRRIIREEAGNAKPEDKEYDTAEAMEALDMKKHSTFIRYLRRNGIICNRKQGKKKYYLHSQLFKTQTFK